MTMPDLLPLAFFFAALLYSSVGHGGASAYLASMALFGMAPEAMKPTALVLNLFVATITTLQFWRARAVPWRGLLPFIVGSIPASFLAARLPVAPVVFKAIVAVALFGAALRLVWAARLAAVAVSPVSPRAGVAVVVGALVGVLAGVTGTGGGIFLTPLLLLRRWADPKTAAGMSAAFILVNSAAGLLGNRASLAHLSDGMPLLIGAVLLGGAIGSSVGTRIFGSRAMRLALALVLVIASGKLLLG